mgnify:CR=1 FL=1
MKTALFSVSYAGLWGQAKLSLDEFVPHARQLGYDGVELMCKRPHLSPLDYDDARVAALAELCRREGMEVACLAAYTNFSEGLRFAEVPLVEMQVQYVATLARFARMLGCQLIRVFTSYESDAAPLAAVWERTVRAIQECCDRSAPFGVTIGIQNHHDVAVHSKALLELLRDIGRPNCKLMADPWSPCLRGEELFETAKRLAPHTVYSTLADYVRLPRWQYEPALINYRSADTDLVRAVPMGEGDLDSATFVRGLIEGGFHGPLAYEMCSPLRGGGSLENLDHCARQFLSWLDRNELRKV